MEIKKEFLEAEIAELEGEARKAEIFIAQASATISAYRMLINRINTPEATDGGDLPEA